MPELPEVEVTRRSFAAQIKGAKVLSVAMGKALRWPLGCEPTSLVGRQVEQVRRRGKYLLIDLDNGMLMVHLGMSGSLRFANDLPDALGLHDHFDMRTDKGTLRLHDPRRFGAVIATQGEADPVAHKLLSGLGMEPLDAQHFTWPRFHAGLQARRTPIKLLLLGGKLVVGVGNIYACEVLFASRIAPTAPANTISAVKARRLYHAIQSILALAVERGGTTLRDFSNADGMPGHFQQQTKVYAREGGPCVRCNTPIALMRQGQRSTYYCPHCQKA